MLQGILDRYPLIGIESKKFLDEIMELFINIVRVGRYHVLDVKDKPQAICVSRGYLHVGSA